MAEDRRITAGTLVGFRSFGKGDFDDRIGDLRSNTCPRAASLSSRAMPKIQLATEGQAVIEGVVRNRMEPDLLLTGDWQLVDGQ